MWRRWSLWSLLIALVVGVLVTLVWLAGRYEASQVQNKVERDTADAVTDIRAALARNIQSFQALHAADPSLEDWNARATAMLRERRELLRIEWRSPALRVQAEADTPYRGAVFAQLGRDGSHSDVSLSCATARRFNGPAYSTSYFLPQPDGRGLEVMDLCLPIVRSGHLAGHVLATYSLQDMLADLIGRQLTRSQEASFIEADGTRLALYGTSRRGARVFSAQQLLDLPGNAMLLRLDSWRSAPDLLPNVLTALVTCMSIALVSVLVLLAKDMRRRQRAERDLADALAFRKAMEDSLLTGLRARDLDGRITYVNPAFCNMVGFAPEELWGTDAPAPYWPPELVGEYEQRQAIRLAGNVPPREGFESVFQRKDGTRFPVLIIEAPLINAQGVQTGWMSAFLDISEQRRVEEISRASQERLQATARLATVGEMASLLSHELNQPLAAISSYATGSLNMLEHAPADAADTAVALRRIAEQAERAGRVIKSVHDFVRRREEAHEAVAPQALLDAIWPLISLQARKLGVQLRSELAPGLPPVRCDRTMVEQVLLNLARNGMQAMDHPSVQQRLLLLRVTHAGAREGASRPNGWLEFSVADGGAGIPGDVAARLFTPFFTTKPEGMGLGLSLCRTVVEQHGGWLGFEANQPQGTVFRFTLPVQVVDTPAIPRAAVA
ncbi:nitrogen regulation protein NR(II) [Pseudorhodoferax sp. Leaf267]|uniref:two-component system sensor histidine kinase NtrB n=1 Tax=Pseudorhodoferax sp. Leaf267 TaxID=1736316 RepID=UPI0006F5D5D9|nr:PAS domain S-box protein [Pseudorhodoferax sp. Leaf267]KQP12858.1 PAS domain-containing sensor histidine kinase [Pseudorhodoferax sp. Leaf267]